MGAEARVDGPRLRFAHRERPDAASIHMCGRSMEILDMSGLWEAW
jgi:hypothetical protein